MKILDLSAGHRAVWFNKKNPFALFLDIRPEVKPDIVCDTRQLPYVVREKGPFDLVVYDPPHVNSGPNSYMAKKFYGYWTLDQIRDNVKNTSQQAYEVTKPMGLMAFKWNCHDIPLKKIMKLMPQWIPLFGHITKDGPTSRSQTYWILLMRPPF